MQWPDNVGDRMAWKDRSTIHVINWPIAKINWMVYIYGELLTGRIKTIAYE